MEWQKIEGTWKGSRQWSHLTTLWRRLQDLLFAIFAIIAWDSVADLTALAALANMGNGSARYVRSLRATFILDTASVEVPDGITVVAALGGGNWVRQAQDDPYWALQSTWYVNATTGDDENDGFTTGAALATLSEFGRRVQHMTLEQVTTVWIEEDCLPTDVLNLQCLGNENARLLLRGVPALALEADVVAFTKDVGAGGANNPGTIELDGWTVADHLGWLITFTTGAAVGGFAWVSADLGANAARIGAILSGALGAFPVAAPNPAPGDTAQVYTLPQVHIALLDVDCAFASATYASAVLDSLFATRNTTQCRGSYFEVYHTRADQLENQLAVVWMKNCSGGMQVYGLLFFYGGTYKNLFAASNVVVLNDLLIDEAFPVTYPIAGITLAEGVVWKSTSAITGFFGTMTNGITINRGAQFNTGGRLIGNITGKGMTLLSDGTAALDPADTNTLVTSGANITMTGGTPTDLTWAQVPYTNPHTGSRVIAANSNTGNLTGGVTTDIKVGIKGALTAVVAPGTTVFALQDLTESAVEVPNLTVQNTVLGNLYAYLGTSPGTAADTVTIVVLVDGAPTALTCALSGATQAASDVNPAHRVRVAPGARISVRVTSVNATGVSFTGANLSVSLELG